MGVQESLSTHREEILRIAHAYGARNVRVFGSAARAATGEDSDIDLLVELDAGVTLLRHNALIRELEDLLGCKVDVVSDRGLRPRIRQRVLAEATPL